jgi:hypothetical protein
VRERPDEDRAAAKDPTITAAARASTRTYPSRARTRASFKSADASSTDSRVDRARASALASPTGPMYSARFLPRAS